MIFNDRKQAGQLLAEKLVRFRNEHPLVLALPRGGLPVGLEIAKALEAPLDVVLVRKIGAPGQEELAAGAIVDGEQPELVLNQEVVEFYDISNEYLEDQKRQQLAEIERRRTQYLEGRAPADIMDKTLIIVDDGIATGASMSAAVRALKRRRPRKVIVAVPVAPGETVTKLEKEADEVICLDMPHAFLAIGNFYQNFAQLTDKDVINILREANSSNKSRNGQLA